MQLYVWIITLTQCVSQLDKSCAELVDACRYIDWAVKSQSFVDAYIDFLKHLVSAHAFYVVPVFTSLVTGFNYRTTLPEGITVTRSTIYERHHLAIRELLKLIPTGSNSLFVSIVRHMPWRLRSTAYQAAYVKNILQITEYAPTLRRQVIGILIDHIADIDTHIQVELDDMDEDIEFDTYNMNFDEDYMSDNGQTDSEDESDEDEEDDNDDLFDRDGSEVDSDYGGGYASDDEEEKPNESKQLLMVKSMVRKLDTLMHLLLININQGLDSTNHLLETYQILLDSFDRTILKTFKSRYTQFLIFYVSSLNSNFNDHFLDHLMQHLMDRTRPNVTRIAAAAYISSYVARAKFMEPSTIQRAINQLCEWCENYIDGVESNLNTTATTRNNNSNVNGTERHDVFYASMQAIMYIFCFRWRDLILQDEDNLLLEDDDNDNDEMELSTSLGQSFTLPTNMGDKKWCRGLRSMPRLLMNKLYPLKICSPPVVRQFARISHQAHFMYIYPLLEKNKEFTIPGVNVNGVSSNGARNLLHTVQTFFPFDPYKLEGSKKFIDPIYFEWIGDDESDDDDDEEEEDDEEDEENVAELKAMSISPSPNQFL